MSTLRLVSGSAVAGLILSAVPQLFAQADWLYHQPGLEKLDNDAWRPVDWRDYKAEMEVLIEECICGFRVPFELPEGTKIVPGEDHKELTKERTCRSSCTLVGHGGGKMPPPDTKVPHGAIDVGSRITRDDGKTLEKLGNAPVRAVHPGGFVRTKGVYPEQEVVCRQGLFRLTVLIEYGHVTPGSRIGTEWQPTPDGNLGRLRGRDSWRCLDPDFSKPRTAPERPAPPLNGPATAGGMPWERCPLVWRTPRPIGGHWENLIV